MALYVSFVAHKNWKACSCKCCQIRNPQMPNSAVLYECQTHVLDIQIYHTVMLQLRYTDMPTMDWLHTSVEITPAIIFIVKQMK